MVLRFCCRWYQYSLQIVLNVTLVILMAGCTGQDILRPALGDESLHECTPGVAGPPALRTSTHQSDKSEDAPRFSPRFQRIAAAMGIVPLLNQSMVLERQLLEGQFVESARLELLQVRQTLLSVTVLTMLEATSLKAVIRCEQAKADRVAQSLAQHQAKRAQLATVVSVIIESATMIATGGLILAGREIAEGIAALIGGTLASGVAGISLLQRESHDFQHPKNVLKEVWENPLHSEYFSEPVWRFLREPSETGISMREQLVTSWQGLNRIEGQSEGERNQRLALLLGSGGLYSIEDLHARGAMLEMLAAAIDLMHDELEILVRGLITKQ